MQSVEKTNFKVLSLTDKDHAQGQSFFVPLSHIDTKTLQLTKIIRPSIQYAPISLHTPN